MSKSNMTCAKTRGFCGRCHKAIEVGELYLWSNLHKKRYHGIDPTTGQCQVTMSNATMDGATDGAAPETETPETESKSTRPVAAPGSIDALIDARIDARLQGFEPETAVDEETVEAIARRVVSQRPPLEIVVTRVDGSKVKVEGAHYLMPRLLRLMGAGIHVYLWGPAGSGKTTAALQAAHALGKDGSEIDTLDPSTPRSAIMGYRTPTGEPVTTAFTRCYTGGQVYVADEADNAPGHVQTIKNSSLANGHAPTAWGMAPRGEGFCYAGTGNTPGAPTPAFPDRRPMSAAFKDRLYFIHWPIDPAIECRAVGLPEPTPPTRRAVTTSPAKWVQWVQKVREYAAREVPTLMVTPRASLVGLQALALGETPEEVAHGLVFRGADEALVYKVLAKCPLPEGE